MIHSKLILTANAIPIVVILVMALLLCFASRFKGKSSYMALLLLSTTLPDYIYNMCDVLGYRETALIVAPIAYSVNLTLMPLMLILAYRTFNTHYTFKYIRLLHFTPAIGFAIFTAIYIYSISSEINSNFSIEQTLMINSPLPPINLLILLAQLIIYTYIIFKYLRKARSYILHNLSRAELAESVWTPRFITIVIILVITAMLGSIFDPLSGFRLFYIISVVAMGYLLYCELTISLASKKEFEHPAIPQEEFEKIKLAASASVSSSSTGTYSNSEILEEKLEQMQNFAKQIEEYLQVSLAYTNPNLSLKDVAKATDISSKNLSRAINIVLGKTFFDLINGYRIEKSKELLLNKKQLGLTLETIAEKCGFNSRFTLNAAFKKATGLTTTQWIKENKNL